MRHAPLLVLLAVGLVPLTSGCDKLLKKKGADAGDEAGATAAASASADTKTADPTPSAEASATPTADALTLPGSCIDPKPDAQKRASAVSQVPVDLENVDLDGDGKADRVYLVTKDNKSFGWVYVMRGTCGHFVGEIPGSASHKTSGNRSHGLKSFELTDTGCQVTPLFFDGAKYVKGKTTTGKCDGGAPAAKVNLPKCTGNTSLVAEGDNMPPFCGKSCSSDADCKPGKCDVTVWMVDETTGDVFTGVGKSTTVCTKGAAPAASASASATPSGALTVPPGNPASIPNPKLLDCPAGYVKLIGDKTCNKSCRTDKCPAGSTCQPPMMFCK